MKRSTTPCERCGAPAPVKFTRRPKRGGIVRTHVCNRCDYKFQTRQGTSLTAPTMFSRNTGRKLIRLRCSEDTLLTVLAIVSLGHSIQKAARLRVASTTTITNVLRWFHQLFKTPPYGTEIIRQLELLWPNIGWEWRLRDLWNVLELDHRCNWLYQHYLWMRAELNTTIQVVEAVQQEAKQMSYENFPELAAHVASLLEHRTTEEELLIQALPHGHKEPHYYMRQRALDPFLKKSIKQHEALITRIRRRHRTA